MIDPNLILLPFFGFLIGLFVTVIGGGGGVFYVPVLTLLFNVPTQLAVATSLACVLPTTVMGTISHNRIGNVNFHIGMIFGIGGIAGALIGAYISNLLPSILLRKILGVFLLIMIIPMVSSALKRQKNPGNMKRKSSTFTGPKKFAGSLFGVVSGILAGVFGISGTPPVTAGLYILGLPAAVVVGTSIFVLIFNSVSGVAGYFMLGQFDPVLIILLGGGGAIGAFLGPKLVNKIEDQTLEKIYAPLLVFLNLILGFAMILR
ncbi:sulfite exporter TauE/SafE family protein [Methanobacterium paludis]|uniref:Probable membrane transporter protein n=1 Tax=Methanobacterium paludis (strain DSM 25820 / JCM 18151 / SWAN1) TaxID=868131 RepID=F6D229_METPW|nr:sulfite exporter TauE/SafE family protein [Methanobacterium paludis]AEG17895.1 protein of unknown function DUF81 [Methanobacterium paludis]